MRRLSVLVLSILGLLAGALVPGVSASAAAHRGYPATSTTVVRPVNASGHAQPGFTINPPPARGLWIDCRYHYQSPGALSPNIGWCSPSAATAIACWKAAASRKALCLTNALKPELTRFPLLHGVWTSSQVLPSERRAPLAIQLANGRYCQIRDGGAWELLPHHPNLYGTYSCGRRVAVWAPAGAPHNGVNESQPSWTVRVGRFGHRTLVERHVVRAWFVATFHA